jgi:hypothetical protein
MNQSPAAIGRTSILLHAKFYKFKQVKVNKIPTSCLVGILCIKPKECLVYLKEAASAVRTRRGVSGPASSVSTEETS